MRIRLGKFVTAAAIVVGFGGCGLLSGDQPQDLGVRDGRLKPPSGTDNSVTSQAGLYPESPQRQAAQIAPLPLNGDGPATIARIGTIVEHMDGGRIVESETDYLYAQYTSRVFGFVDDVEFWYDPVARLVQVRSASRLGSSDLGVNRKRIEAVRARLAAMP